jgi:adenylate cyclase
VSGTSKQDIAFGPFRLDGHRRSLTRDGVPAAVGGRAVDVLLALASAGGETVGKSALLDQVWPGQIVEENNLQVHISALRKALGEGWIVTVPGRGYRLVVPVAHVDPRLADDHLTGSKPSIAVLPFVDMCCDSDQEHFADGMAGEIRAALSHLRSFFVIARNSSFSYKHRTVDVREVGRELGVRYVLEGSVRCGGERLRVGVQLVDTETGSLVWTDSYDRRLADIFPLQDEITEAVARAIEPAISIAEQQRAARKAPGNLSAWEAYQRGLWLVSRPTAQNRAQARAHFERAVELDPMFAPPYAHLASMHILDAASYLVRPAAEAAELAEPLARRAIELDPHDADAHAIATIVDAWKGDWEGALARAEQAVAMNPNSVLAHRARAFCLYNFRRRAEARAELMTCLRLNSRDPQNWLILLQLALTHYLEGDNLAALAVLQDAVRLYPSEPQIVVLLAAALGQLGRPAEGLEALRRAESLLPAGGSLQVPLRAPFKFAEDHEQILEGLRNSGWPG